MSASIRALFLFIIWCNNVNYGRNNPEVFGYLCLNLQFVCLLHVRRARMCHFQERLWPRRSVCPPHQHLELPVPARMDILNSWKTSSCRIWCGQTRNSSPAPPHLSQKQKRSWEGYHLKAKQWAGRVSKRRLLHQQWPHWSRWTPQVCAVKVLCACLGRSLISVYYLT